MTIKVKIVDGQYKGRTGILESYHPLFNFIVVRFDGDSKLVDGVPIRYAQSVSGRPIDRGDIPKVYTSGQAES